MANQIGVIAGSGEFPFLVLKEAQKSGYRCTLAAIKGEAESELQEKIDAFEWFDVDEISKMISYLKNSGVREAVFAGKVDHRLIYRKGKSILESLPFDVEGMRRTPSALLEAVIDYMAKQGIEIKDPMIFLSSLVCEEGLLTQTKLSTEQEEDVAFGWEMARKIADLDIGQTVIVKDKAVVALEGMEGTDEAIKRAGRLACEGTVVVKVTRSHQDFRIDLPAVGLQTVRNCAEAKAKALCFEAQKMPFFQREEAVSFANAHKISVIAKKS